MAGLSFRCTVAFPDDYKTLMPKLLAEIMAAIGSSFVSRINLATGEVIPETKALAKGHYFDYIKFGVKANFKSLYFYSVSSIRVISTVML